MSKLIAMPIASIDQCDAIEELLACADFGDEYRCESLRSDRWVIAEAHREDAPVHGPRVYRNDDWECVFAGDLIGYNTVPFSRIIASFESRKYDFLATLSGIFALVLLDRRSRKLYAVSDRRSQKPLFYRYREGELNISTDLSVFSRLPDAVEFDVKWFWELLYFNFPLGDTTYLKAVKRLPPSSILSYDERSRDLSITSYASVFAAQDKLLTGAEALDLATEVFAGSARRHYDADSGIACAITAGWDGRTVLGLAPRRKGVTAYTYGVPGCRDIEDGSTVTRAIDIDHIRIPLGRDFVSKLPEYALETVYLSGGLQSVLRSTLYHMYEELTAGGRRFPTTVSGISLGNQIRGQIYQPDLICPGLAQQFTGAETSDSLRCVQEVLNGNKSQFCDAILSKTDELETSFGAFESTEHHLSYTVYPLSTHYFCGELAISDRFTTVRVPAWDIEVLELMYSIEYSMLTTSIFVSRGHRSYHKNMVLQAHLLKQFAPDLFRLPVRGIHPASILAGEVATQAERIYRGVQRRFAKSRTAPLENWTVWLFDKNRNFIDAMLQSMDTQVSAFVNPSVVGQVIATQDTRLLGKLLTAEIVLRLIKNRWQRFW